MDNSEIDGRLQALIQQRDEAMNRCVLQAGIINKLQQENTKLKNLLDENVEELAAIQSGTEPPNG